MSRKKQTEDPEKGLKIMLRSTGLKVTPVRLCILELLAKTGRPMAHSEVQTAMPELDRVTIYRTLASFVDAGIAHQVQGLDGMWRFCAHNAGLGGCPGNHPHFLCTSCGRMICLLDQQMPRVDVPDGHWVNGKQFVAYGICSECAASKQVRISRGEDEERDEDDPDNSGRGDRQASGPRPDEN
ncbi:MAG: transcriptional repressor [Synergistaceae bacterium]|nr:transcriptional repressor [Synergistaceae bacterium]